VQLTSNRVRRGSQIAMAVGAVLIVVTLLVMWLGSSDDDKLTSNQDLENSQGLQPYNPDLVESKSPGSVSTKKNGLNTMVGGTDPFAKSTGDDTPHKVQIKFTSDGALYAGWRYRTKGGEGVKVAEKSLTVGKTVRGGLPAAQAAVQVLRTATYATCTIYIDGVAVTTQTAKGANHVTVCVG
jgi:hypothetical protein